MAAMRRLLLWDIDGTLLRAPGVGSGSLYRAVAAIAEVVHVPKVNMHGKTDPQILREIFHEAEFAGDVDAALPEAMRLAEANLAAAEGELRANGFTLPGVVEILDRLSAIDGVTQTLVTGNLVANAAVKVGAFDLTHHFDVEIGAYGSDHEDRLELVPIALARAARLRGETYDPATEVWVIGDTERDLACARAGGARCLLVATGTPTWEALSTAGADHALPDLSDVDAVVEVLTRS
jgi:phosphoglycolate phosphatase